MATSWTDLFAAPIGDGSGLLGVGEFGLLHVRDEKPANTQGGTFTSGDWRTRDLTTVVTNEIAGASLSSNQITLPAGTYDVLAFAQGLRVNQHKTRLRDITNAVDLLIGSSAFADTGAGAPGTESYVSGRFTITATTVIELQHRCITTVSTFGFGSNTNVGVIEIYADIVIRRITAVQVANGLPFKGALVVKSGTQSIANVTNTDVTWQTATYDTDSFFSGGDPTKLTVPEGVTRVRLSGVIDWSATTSNNKRSVIMLKNNSTFVGAGQNIRNVPNAFNDEWRQPVVSAIVDVVPGDFFEIQVRQTSGGGKNIETNSWFAIEVIEGIAPSTTPRGALVKQATSFSLPNNSTSTVTWNEEVYDTDDIHSNVTDNSRLTVPAGVTHVRLSGSYVDSSNTSGWRFLQLRKNSGSVPGLTNQSSPANGSNTHFMSLSSPVLEVVAGDFFEMQIFQNSGSTRSVSGDIFWFAMEIVEPAVLGTSDPAQILQTLVDGANISWNHNTSRTAQVTLADNRTLDNPTNSIEGLEYTLKIIQDATGSRTLAYGSAYKFAGGTPPTLTAAPNAVDVLRFWFDGTDYIKIGFEANVS